MGLRGDSGGSHAVLVVLNCDHRPVVRQADRAVELAVEVLGLVHGDLADRMAIVDHGPAVDLAADEVLVHGCRHLGGPILEMVGVARPLKERVAVPVRVEDGLGGLLVPATITVKILACWSGSAWKMSGVTWSTMWRSRARRT